MPGIKVRLASDPTRLAITTGRIKNRGPFTLVQIEFGTNDRPFKRLEQLDRVPDVTEDLATFLSARKWSGAEALRRALAIEKLKGNLTDVFYSMESSRTDFFAHQFKPVLKFAESPTGRILIADEVGLGKTIEAIYLWKEVEAREHAQRLLIVCPSMLREKWRADMERLFSLEAEIVDARALKDRLDRARVAPRSTSFALIASFEAARPPRDFLDSSHPNPRAAIGRLLHAASIEDDDPLIDLVVVDEAHYMRNASTLTHRLGRLLGDAARHMALLTATPIQIGSENLFNLLRLLDPDVLEDSYQFDRMLQANAPIVNAQRSVWAVPPDLKEAAAAIEQASQNEYFSEDPVLPRLAKELHEKNDLTPARRVEIGRALETRSLIGQYMTRSRKREVIEKRVERSSQVLTISFTPRESQVYEGITQALRTRSEGLQGVSVFALIGRQRQMASSLPAALYGWNETGALADLAWEDFGELLSLDESKITLRDTPGNDAGLGRELEASDSKYTKLRDAFLTPLLINNPDEKVIIFAFYRGTLKYLQRRLEEDGFETVLIMGGQGRSPQDRQEALTKFADPRGPSILLSSEVGSEGIDLQFCRIVVNYDLPWNPMRVEQRIGRVDRLGQKAERISIVNLCVENTIEDKILMRLYHRIALFRDSIGDLEEILGEVSSDLLTELFNPNLTDAEREQKAEESILAIENMRIAQEQLESQAINMIGFSDYLMDMIKEARALGRWLSPQEMIALVDDFFRNQYPGTLLEPIDGVPNAIAVTLSPEARHTLANFVERSKSSRRSQLESVSRAVVCLFDARRTEKLPRGAELVDPMHPLVRWIEEEYAASGEHLAPPVGLEVSRELVEQPAGLYAFACEKWSLSGIRGEAVLAFRAIHIESGKRLDSLDAERLVGIAARSGKRLPYAALDDARLSQGLEALETCTKRLSEDFGERLTEFELENAHRCRQQLTSAERLAARKIDELEVRISKMERDGKQRGARLARSQVQKQKDLLEAKRRRIERGSEVDPRVDEISGGFILIGQELGGVI